MPDYIDQISESIGAKVEYARRGLTQQILNLYKKGMEREELLALIQQVDFSSYLLDELGLGGIYGEATGEYQALKEAMEKEVGPLSQKIVTQLKNQDMALFRTKMGDIGTELKQSLLDAAAIDIPEQQIQANLIKATKTLRADQVTTLVNTAMRTSSRQMFASGTDELGPNARYTYTGPIDSRNRVDCRDVLDDPQNDGKGFTRAEIAGLLVDFINGGGWNCRHRWHVVSA